MGTNKIFSILGSHFCPSEEESQVIIEIYYSDLSYRVSVEDEEYPLKEMVNEWIGIAGIYFGFSLITLASMINKAIITYRRKAQLKQKVVDRFSAMRLGNIVTKKAMEVDTMPQG